LWQGGPESGKGCIMKKMTVGNMIKKLKQYDLDMEIVLHDDIGKGVRKSTAVKYPTCFNKQRIVFALCKEPIGEDQEVYDGKYERKECLVVS
jgi:hypothetical protein